MSHQNWKVKKTSHILSNPWLRVRADVCETPGGAVLDPYYVIECEDWVHMVVFDAAHRVLLIRLYRHGIGGMSLEIPGGMVEEGEEPEAAARRELLEETGYSSGRFVKVGNLTPNSARQTNTMHCYAVFDARKVQEPDPDHTEEITCEWVTIPELQEMIRNGAFRQALHIAAIHLALEKLRRMGGMKDEV